MAKNPLSTKFTEMMGIEFPILAFTHCKDVVAAVVNAGGFAVLGEAMHTPEHIADDIKWIRSRVGDKPFGIDLVLPSSAPPTDTLDQLLAKIPEEQRAYEQKIIKEYDVPPPKNAPEARNNSRTTSRISMGERPGDGAISNARTSRLTPGGSSLLRGSARRQWVAEVARP